MAILSQPQVIELLDSVGCALLAAAASFRAGSFGARATGSVALGCMAGLSGPLLRELALHGQNGAAMLLGALPDDALIGALGALAALFILKGRSRGLFIWLDGAGMGLAACLAAALGARELGIAGALTLGLICGLAPGVIRDCALGDTAMLVEESWYATAAALGCVICLCLLLAPALLPLPSLFNERGGEIAVLAGALTTMLIRGVKGSKIN